MKILILEDEGLIALGLKRNIETLGYEVFEIALNPQQAIVLARRYKPDILLADINLEGAVDGIEVADMLAKELNVAIVFVTAYSDDETLQRAKTVVPHGYLTKPIGVTALKVTLEMVSQKIESERLKSAEIASHQRALQTVGDALLYVDADGSVVGANRAAEQLLNVDVEQIIDETFSTSFAGIAAGEFEWVMQESMSSRKLVRLPVLRFLHNGARGILVDAIIGVINEADKGLFMVMVRPLIDSHHSDSEILLEFDQRTDNEWHDKRSISMLVIGAADVPGDGDSFLGDELLRDFHLRVSRLIRDDQVCVLLPGTGVLVILRDIREKESASIADAIHMDLTAHCRHNGINCRISIGLVWQSASADIDSLLTYERSRCAMSWAMEQAVDVVSWAKMSIRQKTTSLSDSSPRLRATQVQEIQESLASPGFGRSIRPDSLTTLELPDIDDGAISFQSRLMSVTMSRVNLVSNSDSNVLLCGEPGVGKLRLSRYIHTQSTRRKNPCITVNCAEVSSEAFDQLLFGAGGGGGVLRQADRSTLVFQNLEMMPIRIQVKLSEVLKAGALVNRRGHASKLDTRIIGLVNIVGDEESDAARLNAELFSTLSVVEIKIPSLRERREDIPLLVEKIISELNVKQGKDIAGVTPDALRALLDHDWPQNHSELKRVIRAAFDRCPSNQLSSIHLGLYSKSKPDIPIAQAVKTEADDLAADANHVIGEVDVLVEMLGLELRRHIEHCIDRSLAYPLSSWLEQDLCEVCLERSGGNMIRAAHALRVSPKVIARIVDESDREKAKKRLYGWHRIRDALSELVGLTENSEVELLTTLSNLLLTQVSRSRATHGLGASLMGVTPPTYRKMRSSEPGEDLDVIG